jgi:guanylate kinase
MSNFDPIIFILGPSGVGKSTLMGMLRKKYTSFLFPRSYTTRPPRDENIENDYYNYISDQEFKDLIEQNAFLEYALVHQKYYYGTLRSDIFVKNNTAVIKEIDVIGYKKLLNQESLDNVFSLFIHPPSLDILEERIKKRGGISKEDILHRMESAQQEIQFAPHCTKEIESIEGSFDKTFEIFENTILDIKNLL